MKISYPFITVADHRGHKVLVAVSQIAKVETIRPSGNITHETTMIYLTGVDISEAVWTLMTIDEVVRLIRQQTDNSIAV